MSLTILKTPDGKIVRINPDSDVRLYDAPTNPPNTGTKYTRGTDLYAHKARSGAVYYYLYHWSMWQGEESRYELINADAAREVLLTCATYSDHRALTEKEVSLAEEHFPGIFEETA